VKKTTKTILKKKGVEKITMITAYDAMFARMANEADIDVILIGDSLGNTILGYDSTVPVTIDDMIHHTAAVARAKPDSLILADVPFGTAHFSFDKVLQDCRRLVQEGGAEALKIEGGKAMADTVAKLVNAGIAVMGHIGLEPQQVLRLGGYRKFGKTDEEREQILADAKALEEAGAFAILLEMTDHQTAKLVTQSLSVPTIGIGAGGDCDGQVLVCADVLGINDKTPSFVKKYASLHEEIVNAYKAYVKDVKSNEFPSKE